MSFTNLSTGSSHSFGGDYHKVVPNESLDLLKLLVEPEIPDQG